MKNNAWIQTYTGKKFFPLNPNVSDICIEDIAQALSNICRFNGHCKHFYSVAQHSVIVSYMCNEEYALQGLLHDSSEGSGLGDWASPVKNSGEFENYKFYEKQLQEMIYKKFNLPIKEHPSVKEADIRVLATEARDLMQPLHPDWNQPAEPYNFTITPLPPKEAKELFLFRFKELVL
jgi:hypothetical protein